jgi:radical SAM protein with 4Fe4S-binding SPASM domain
VNYSLSNDLLNSNKILYCLAEKLPDYMEGKRNFNPWSIEIHPTSRCNYKCVFCSYQERNEKRSILDQAMMKNLVESIIKMKIKGVYLSGGGEPSAYPNLTEHIKRLYENNVETAIITNGYLLNKTGIVEIANMLNYIAVSIASVQPENYQKITNVDGLATVLKIPEQIKNRHGEKSPIIGSRIVVSNLNVGEIEEILLTIKESLFDYALFKIVRDYEDRGLGLNSEEEERLKKTVVSMRERGLIDKEFTNLDLIFDYKKTENKYTEKCLVNEMGLLAVVDSDGKVYPNIVEIGKEDFCIGDLNKTPLDKMWHSVAHDKVKETSNAKCQKNACKNCRAIAYNGIMSNILGSLPRKKDSFI